MSKKRLLWILLDLVFLAIFNIVFFVVGGTQHPASVWISYVFIHVAYLTVVVTPFLIRKSSGAAVFGFSLYAVSSIYFIVEFLVGLIFIFAKPESGTASFIVQLILFGLYAVILLSNLLANEHTADGIERHEAEVDYIKQVSARVKLLQDKLDDPKANKAIDHVYDELHASPTKSISAAAFIENEIKEKISSLELAIRAKDADGAAAICGELLERIQERNTLIRTNQ